MTLVKTKHRRPSAAHRQRVGEHHHRTHHYTKAYWPYLPMLAIVGLGFLVNSWLGQVDRSVLGYATDMSVQSLLEDTNAERHTQGEVNLRLNSTLNDAAQAKANDMAAHNYWSHNTPTGQTPWSFIIAAGYDYRIAGENLAYGFASAGDTVTGWMNSPEHRTNILNANYQDVGFGIVNIADYQGGGPETLVVAMYGTPADASLAGDVIQKSANNGVTTYAGGSAVRGASNAVEPASQNINRLQLLATNATWGVPFLTILAVGAYAFLILKHTWAWRKVVVRGERFVIKHPALDVAAVSVAMLGMVLGHTSGLIR